MQTYTLSQVRNRHGEVFDRAFAEPVFVTNHNRPSHVILAAELYNTLIKRSVDASNREDDAEFARQMALAEEGMSRYRNTLRALAK